MFLSTSNEENSPSSIQSPVLRQVYPALLEHKRQYGNPNIPLGTSEGRQCQTLRRLHIQQKLTDDEVLLLENLGFLFHSLEQVYETGDFDDLYQRLLKYLQETGDVSPPKKYPADPELGAWVTGIRRLGPNKVQPEHVDKLNDISFQWTSNRKCGSAFMKQYRQIQERLAAEGDSVLEDADIQKWIQAQREAAPRMSETRKHYMERLLGRDWISLNFKQ